MISKDKQYRTRDGREVRIYATDGCCSDKIHGAVKDTDGWEPHSWLENGTYYSVEESLYDLVEIRPRIKREYWVNLYPETEFTGMLCLSKHHADNLTTTRRIACVKVVIDCEEGEGL